MAPELVPGIFDLFSSRKPGSRASSYEPGQPGSYEEALNGTGAACDEVRADMKLPRTVVDVS